MKSEIKAELKAELIAELGTIQPSWQRRPG
jgi:hypothetical protein